MKPKYDILWKGMIEEVIEDLLLFVEPEIGKELDLGRGFQFMDKELAEMYPEPTKPANTKVVDKLVKVFLRDGAERHILIHLEVQGKKEKAFARRMFEYYIRIFSKHDCPVAAIAIFTGRSGNKMPGCYEDRCLWMRTRYEYKTVSITDYSDEVLRASTNPFAAVMMVTKEGLLKLKGTDEERDNLLFEQKMLMVRLLKEKLAIFGERKTRAIIAFLNNYVVFRKPENNYKFVEQTDEIIGKKDTMGIFEQLAEIRHQEGREEGVEETKVEIVRSLLTKTEFSLGKIADIAGVSVYFVKKIRKELNAK